VVAWSPVTIITRIPASWQRSIASMALWRGWVEQPVQADEGQSTRIVLEHRSRRVVTSGGGDRDDAQALGGELLAATERLLGIELGGLAVTIEPARTHPHHDLGSPLDGDQGPVLAARGLVDRRHVPALGPERHRVASR
jgi:hypothetical protein